MMVVTIAVIWIVVGFAVAIVCGFVLSRSNPVDENEVPNRTRGQVQYMRRFEDTDCNAVRANRAERRTSEPHFAG